MAETSAPAPEISEETQRLLATDAQRTRSRASRNLPVRSGGSARFGRGRVSTTLTANPGDREALRTVRRGFHTLKGSGRMVGLAQLGDFAFDTEKVCNRLIEEERPVTPAVLAMIGVAQKSFRHWVDALTQSGRVTADPRELHAAIAAVEAEIHGAAEESPPESPPVPHPTCYPMCPSCQAATPSRRAAAARPDRAAGTGCGRRTQGHRSSRSTMRRWKRSK